MTEQEQWRQVHGYEGAYEVSSHGRVRSVPRAIVRSNGRAQSFQGKVLSVSDDTYGYPIVGLSKGGRMFTAKVHRLVCRAFHGAPPSGKHEVSHLDGNPSNNTPPNLRWATRSENISDGFKGGRIPLGSQRTNSKLTPAAVSFIREMRGLPGYTIRSMAAMFGVSRSTVQMAASGKTWKHIPQHRSSNVK